MRPSSGGETGGSGGVVSGTPQGSPLSSSDGGVPVIFSLGVGVGGPTGSGSPSLGGVCRGASSGRGSAPGAGFGTFDGALHAVEEATRGLGAAIVAGTAGCCRRSSVWRLRVAPPAALRACLFGLWLAGCAGKAAAQGKLLCRESCYRPLRALRETADAGWAGGSPAADRRCGGDGLLRGWRWLRTDAAEVADGRREMRWRRATARVEAEASYCAGRDGRGRMRRSAPAAGGSGGGGLLARVEMGRGWTRRRSPTAGGRCGGDRLCTGGGEGELLRGWRRPRTDAAERAGGQRKWRRWATARVKCARK
nr:uncharacterized protein LOC127303175 [Lolium perenne]